MAEQTHSAKTETEAKFIIRDAEIFAALKNSTQLGEFDVRSTGTKRIVDRYVDGSQRQIFRAGYACRLRKDRAGGQKITLKALTPAVGHLHRREEIEAVVEADQPDAWPESEAKHRVQQMLGSETLQSLFTIYQTRHTYHLLREGQPVIELSLDGVTYDEVDYNEGRVDYYEVEAELLPAGREADLADGVVALESQFALQPQTQSKFERALARYSLNF